MSRSYRKTPIIGVASPPSEKADKQRANQAHRATMRSRNDPEIPLRAVSNVWDFGKDGKVYVTKEKRGHWWWNKLMRK